MMKLFLVAGITSVVNITSAATSSTARLRCSDRSSDSEVAPYFAHEIAIRLHQRQIPLALFKLSRG